MLQIYGVGYTKLRQRTERIAKVYYKLYNACRQFYLERQKDTLNMMKVDPKKLPSNYLKK